MKDAAAERKAIARTHRRWLRRQERRRGEGLVAVEVKVLRLTQAGAELDYRGADPAPRMTSPAWFARAAIRTPDVDLEEGLVVTAKLRRWALDARGWPTGETP